MDENDPASPIIHIGYAKAASTWLQKQIFARHEMGFHKLSRYDASGAFTVTNHLDHDPEAIRRSLQPWLDEASERGLVPVISLERLVGHFDLGGYDSRSTADRLHETYGQARIIIVVREQAGIILSSYRHYSRAGGVVSLRRYLRGHTNRDLPTFGLDHFKYHRLIAYYHGLFGERNVLILPIELLREEPSEFLARLYSFCGLEIPDELDVTEKKNVSFSGPALAMKRLINRASYGARNPAGIVSLPARWNGMWALKTLDRLVPGWLAKRSDNRARALIDQFANGCFKESNGKTAELTGLDLAAYGYDM